MLFALRVCVDSFPVHYFRWAAGGAPESDGAMSAADQMRAMLDQLMGTSRDGECAAPQSPPSAVVLRAGCGR